MIAVTQREQVAQIFNKPIYVITDVAFLPLTTQEHASEAIKKVNEARRLAESNTDYDFSDSDLDETSTAETPRDHGSSVAEDDHAGPHSGSTTSIAQDVFAKRGQFGRFASQWFSRQGWATGKGVDSPNTTTKSHSPEKTDSSTPAGESTGPAFDTKQQPHANVNSHSRSATSIDSMLPNILRTSRLILSSRSFFFSYEVDITRRMSLLKGVAEAPTRAGLDPLVRANDHIGENTLTLPVLLEPKTGCRTNGSWASCILTAGHARFRWTNSFCSSQA